jgi:DNA-binding winged helix-turn-helix (wHTH) protein/thioredoxin-like negative regulator of GroEL
MMQSTTACHIDDLMVDFDRRKVFRRDGSEISLPALSFDTLKALIEAAPAVLSANELIDRAWRGSVVSDETVTQRIRLLRQALQDDRRQPRYIETLRNVGYRLIPPVSTVPHVADNSSSFHRMIAGGVIAVLVIGVTAWMLESRQEPVEIEDTAAGFSLGPVTAVELSDQARTLVRQRNQDSLRHAIDLYEQALEMEPDNVDIRAALSLALSTSVAWYGDSIELAARAERLARQAAESGNFFQAEFALGFSLDAQGKIGQAQAAYERALALDPEHYGVRASLAYLLQVKGRLVEALSHNMIAYEKAPPGMLDSQIASCLRLLGFYSIASEWLDRTNQLDPDSAHAAPARALDLITRHEFDEGRRIIDMALARGVEQVELYEYRIVLALLNNDINAAREVLDSVPASIGHRGPFEVWRIVVNTMTSGVDSDVMEKDDAIIASADADTWPDDYLYAAILEAAAGHDDRAIAALQRLAAAGYRDYLWLSLLPTFADLHGEPAFDHIVAGMRADVDRQRAQLLTAEWLPPEWRLTELSQINPLPTEE